VHLNPFLCPSKISPLVNNVLKWNKNDSKRSIDISDTTNGNAMACKCGEEARDRVNFTLSMPFFSLSKKKPTMCLFQLQYRHCIPRIPFNVKSETEIFLVSFTVCFVII